jgi:predicted permease
MLAGGLLARFGLLDAALRRGLNRLLFVFVIPVMVFASMRTSIDRELLQTSYWPILFGVGLCLVNLLVATLLASLIRLPMERRRIFAFLNMFGNNIYLGIPIALALFGTEGVAIVLLYSLGSDLVLWSLGLFLLSPKREFSPSSLRGIFTPTLAGLLLGAAWGVAGLGFPDALANAMDSVGNLASPLALLLTGAALAEIKFARGILTRDIPFLLIGKLVTAPLIAFAAVALLQLPPVMKMLMVILAGMPTFVRSIVLTDQYGWDSQQTATGVLATTLGSFISIPLILSLLG